MTTASFILRNTLRNKRRAMLSAMSVAVSLFLFITLQVTLRELTIPPEDVGASLRIAVRNKVSLAQPLPFRQLQKIEKINGVEAVTPFTYFGGLYRNESFTTFAQFAVDPIRFTNVFVEAKTSDAHLNAWIKDQGSCLVGVDTMKRYNLEVGEKMLLSGTFYPVDLDMEIVGTYEGTLDDRNVFFHHKYLDELTDDPGTVGTWWLRAGSAEVAPKVVRKINETFANTSAEVRAESERAFQMGFVSMWGNIQMLIDSICSAIVFTLLLVTVSTMSMAIRERFRELAILKAIGYRRHELLAFILAESLFLSLLGAFIGAGGAAWLFSTIDIQKMSGGMFIFFEVTNKMLGTAFLISMVLGVIAGIAPGWSVCRMSVVDGLKTLD
jgi:putative ABC transport system permease protein